MSAISSDVESRIPTEESGVSRGVLLEVADGDDVIGDSKRKRLGGAALLGETQDTPVCLLQSIMTKLVGKESIWNMIFIPVRSSSFACITLSSSSA